MSEGFRDILARVLSRLDVQAPRSSAFRLVGRGGDADLVRNDFAERARVKALPKVVFTPVALAPRADQIIGSAVSNATKMDAKSSLP